VKVFRLVALTDVAALDVVADEAAGVRIVEGGAKSVERLLYALMAHAVGRGEELRPQRRCRWDEHLAAVHDEPVHHGRGRTCRSVSDFLTFGGDVIEGNRLLPEVVEDGELGRGQR